MSSLIWADWLIIAVLVISALISLKRGFVKEALSLASWIAAFVVARTFHPNLQTLLVDVIDTSLFRAAAAFAILFIVTLMVGSVINFMVSSLVKATGLSSTDRIFGMVFGLFRGVIVLIVAVAVLRLTPLAGDDWWQQSVLIDKLVMLESWTRQVFGDQIHLITG